ncbi:MAG TPA: VWA domain-containing protein [Rickettsia endosymbiont of Omalisus fontisbellaquei]|nr:VWA domain-containing protein [Rickettsia endosymbiont of Omalisus fontisbellaquei]
MPIQHLTSEKKWEIFLNAIGTKVEVTKVTDNKVIFKTNSKDLEHFRTLLASPDELKKNVIHALFKDNENKPKKLEEAEPNSIDTSDIEAGQLFHKLVDGDFITKFNLSETFNAMKLEAKFNEELLTTQFQFSFSDPLQQNLNETKLKMLQATITDENKLSKILTGKEAPAIDYTYPPTEFSKLISQIISHTENNSLTFTLNNGATMQAVQAYKADDKPPIIASDLESGFILDKQYLLKYLFPILNGFVWQEEDKLPIMFSSKDSEAINNDNTHYMTLLIDISSSMKSTFDTYKDNIQKILTKLVEIPNWEINIVAFNDQSSMESFSSKENTIEDIKRYVEAFNADGCTRLYGTVKDALESFKEKIDMHSTIIVFTDGKNEGTDCKTTQKEVIDSATDVIQNPQFNMYAVGFGEHYSREFFEEIAMQGGFTHVSLTDSNGMNQLEQYIDNIGQKVVIWKILGEKLNLVTRVQKGDVFIGKKIETETGTTFYIDGQEFTIGIEESDTEIAGVVRNCYDEATV